MDNLPSSATDRIQSYLNRLEQAEARKKELEEQIALISQTWSLARTVANPHFLGYGLNHRRNVGRRGQDVLAFDNPRKLKAYLGLVPGSTQAADLFGREAHDQQHGAKSLRFGLAAEVVASTHSARARHDWRGRSARRRCWSPCPPVSRWLARCTSHSVFRSRSLCSSGVSLR